MCGGGGDSTSRLWGFKSEGRLDHYAHVLNQRKLLVVGVVVCVRVRGGSRLSILTVRHYAGLQLSCRSLSRGRLAVCRGCDGLLCAAGMLKSL